MLLGAARRVMLYEITMDVERLMAGEAVEESAYYFRTAPLFETGTQVAYSVYAIR